jgi:hypothetical protein
MKTGDWLLNGDLFLKHIYIYLFICFGHQRYEDIIDKMMVG